MRLTSSQLETIRKRPQVGHLDLFIFEPMVIFSAQINDPDIARNDYVISYYNSSGTYTDIEDGMITLVGTTRYGDDVGRVRARSATYNSLTVAENSDIDWQENQFITVKKFFPILPVFPRTIQNPPNTENVTFYKDYDIVYTGQNSTLGTFINMGSHRPVLLENATGTVFWSASGSYNIVSDGTDWLTYSWVFEGGTPSTSTAHTPGLVTYTTPGDYVTKLTVSASGTVDTSYRYVSVRNEIGEGSNTPIVRWTMDDLSGSRSEGGYNVDITIHDNITITEDCVIMLRSDGWYGDSHQSFGNLGQENVFFVGYVEKGSIRYSYDRSYFTFTATSVTSIMKQTTGFSISVESMQYPSKWYELLDMDVRRAIYHYLRWHSTVLKTTDVEFRGQDYKVQYFDADRTSIHDAIDNLMRNGLVGTVCSDRLGKVWCEVEPMAYTNPTGSFSPIMEISRRDWKSEPDITENFQDVVSYVEKGGVAYSGSNTGTFSAYLSSAPGTTPSTLGSVDKSSGLILYSQDQLNYLTGHIYANKNQRFPSIALEMSEDYRNLDIAPYETVQMNILPSDTVRNVAINAPYIPTDISYTYDSRNQLLLPVITFNGLVNGIPGQTLTIPPEVTEDFTTPDYGFPDFPSDLDIGDYSFVTDPILTDPAVLYPCGNGNYSINSYNLTWSKSIINGTDSDRTAKAYLPCVIHRAAPFGSTTVIRLNIYYFGDADQSKVRVYAFQGGNRVASATYSGNGYEFILAGPMRVDGFEVELEEGAGSIITYSPGNTIGSGAIPVNDPVGTKLNGLVAGNYYCVDGAGGPWHWYFGYPWSVWDNFLFNFGDGGVIPGGGYGWDGNEYAGAGIRLDGSGIYGEQIGSTKYGRGYFLYSGANVHVGVPSGGGGGHGAYTGVMSYILRNAVANGRRIQLLPGHIENICPPNTPLV